MWAEQRCEHELERLNKLFLEFDLDNLGMSLLNNLSVISVDFTYHILSSLQSSTSTQVQLRLMGMQFILKVWS